METIIGYIVIFGFGIVFVTMFMFRKDKEIMLPITEQAFPQLVMAIFIKKEKRKITEIILQFSPPKKALQICDFHLELTNERHEKETVDLKPLMEITAKAVELRAAQSSRFTIPFRAFETLLSNQGGPYDRFRFVAVTPENIKFKSFTLGLNTRWGLFKQDSGRYN